MPWKTSATFSYQEIVVSSLNWVTHLNNLLIMESRLPAVDPLKEASDNRVFSR